MYESVGVSPSSSVAVAVQVRLLALVTPVLGTMDTLVTSGAVLPTETAAESVPVPPSESVAVAVHVMLSSGELVEMESVTEASVPRLVPSVALVQA
jgi:hypothetical protein